MTEKPEVERAVADAHRQEWARVLAATACVTRDLDLAEECVQEAYASALVAWDRDGLPAKPAAWLTTAAKRRALDALRRQKISGAKLPLLIVPDPAPDEGALAHQANGEEVAAVADERLRLVFMCCHPALAQEAQLALTLRLVCGVPTHDVAKALLVPEPTMAARLTRAKRKIVTARIAFRVPRAAELPDRLRPVLGVVYLLFTMGHTSPSGVPLSRRELVDQALRLARLLRELMPDEPEVRGLLALILATDARRATRTGADGHPLKLAEQDRSRWDSAAIAEARQLVGEGPARAHRGRYVLQAAIALVHAESPSYDATDWAEVLQLYDRLLAAWPSPVVALNRAVALAMLSGPEAALAEVAVVEQDGRLARYHYLYAVKAELLRQMGREDEAAELDRKAMEMTENQAEQNLLADRVARPR